MTENNEIPDDAMRVEAGHDDGENYVRFAGTDVIEWYTELPSGKVIKEQFVSTEPQFPEDIEMLTDSDNIVVTYDELGIRY